MMLFSSKISIRYSERVLLSSSNFAANDEATIIASVALFSLIAIAFLPARDSIKSSEPIIIPPDSSPPKIKRG